MCNDHRGVDRGLDVRRVELHTVAGRAVVTHVVRAPVGSRRAAEHCTCRRRRGRTHGRREQREQDGQRQHPPTTHRVSLVAAVPVTNDRGAGQGTKHRDNPVWI